MSVFIMKRGPVQVLSIPVTITGTGNASYCYAMIGGAQYTAAATGIEVMAGDTITFAVYSYNTKTYYGSITVDGVEVFVGTVKGLETYEWIVPEGISSVTVALSVGTRNAGVITITTA